MKSAGASGAEGGAIGLALGNSLVVLNADFCGAAVAVDSVVLAVGYITLDCWIFHNKSFSLLKENGKHSMHRAFPMHAVCRVLFRLAVLCGKTIICTSVRINSLKILTWNFLYFRTHFYCCFVQKIT